MASTETDRLAGVTASLASKAPVRAASTANLTLSGAQTIDSIAVVADDRVLVKNQTDGIENGIYDAKSGAWVRALDFNGTRDVVTGTFVVVGEGTSGAGTLWRVTTTGDITIGTTSIAFAIMTVDSVTAYIATLLDDGTAAEARGTLGLDTVGQVEAEAGTATTDRAWTAERVSQAIAALTLQSSPGHISALVLSNDTDTNHDINVTAGAGRNAANDGDLVLASEQTKQIDASWATGDDAGGLSSALTVATNTWYHLFLVLISGTVEVGFDTSVVAANLIASDGATKFRRIGSVLTNGSANIIGFISFETAGGGLEFVWGTIVADFSDTNPGTTSQTPALSTPLGIETQAKISAIALDANSAGTDDVLGLVTAVDTGAQTVSISRNNFGTEKAGGAAATYGVSEITVRTDLLSQVRIDVDFSDAGVTIKIATFGWIDERR